MLVLKSIHVSKGCQWWEHPRYLRTSASVRPLGSLSAVGLCGTHLTSQLHHPDLFVCSTLSMFNIKHTICSFVLRWLSRNSCIFEFWRKYIFTYMNIFSEKNNMWNQNINGVYTIIFTKVRKTCSKGVLSRRADWELQDCMPDQWYVKWRPGSYNWGILVMPLVELFSPKCFTLSFLLIRMLWVRTHIYARSQQLCLYMGFSRHLDTALALSIIT